MCCKYATKWNEGLTLDQIHDHNTRLKNNIYSQFLRLNKSRNSNNYYSINFFNHLPEEIRKLPYTKFKMTLKIVLVATPMYNYNDFF